MIWVFTIGWVLCWVFSVWAWHHEEDVTLFHLVVFFVIAGPLAGVIGIAEMVESRKLNPIVFRRRK